MRIVGCEALDELVPGWAAGAVGGAVLVSVCVMGALLAGVGAGGKNVTTLSCGRSGAW